MPLTSFESDLITFLDQQYQLTGELLTAESAFQNYGIPVGKFKRALENPDFKEALTERGIVFQRFDKDDWTKESLTPIQLLVANSLLDLTDTRTNKKKLQDLGVSTLQYNSWLRDPVFKNYLHKRAEQMIGDNRHEVDTALLDRVRAGDLKAISYYNEFTGRYTPQRYNGQSNVDISMLIAKIIEIIGDEVSDPDTLYAISTRLRGLIAARNTANALLGSGDSDTLPVPEVVKAAPIPELS